MADTSHDVVEAPQLASMPLADAALKSTAADSAQPSQPPANAATTSEINSSIAAATNELAATANALPGKDPAGLDAVKDAVEPSAGEAAQTSAAESTDAPAQRLVLEEKVIEDGSQGDDGSTADISVDASFASDNEKKGDPHHVRSNSVKKPTTFSKVSVTKTFLNKAAPTATAVPSKIGDKPSPASVATLTAKVGPRLVAKSGPSLQNLQKTRPGPQSASGPDASKVWNKNRPVPQAPPKQFTDEELKQQYGIHLATRLQTDDGGNDSKWADIDDEDDWAPEAVEWMDGTKSTVAPPPEVAPPEPPMQRPVQQQQPPTQRTVLHLAPRTAAPPQESAPVPDVPAVQPEASKPAEAVKPILAAKRSDSQSMKILKPGAANQAKLNGPSPSGTDKPSLKAKNPAPPQTSPWKPVPKPESVSAINPPTQVPQAPAHFAPLASQDARAYEQPQHIPAREIAADTFDRSWREGEGGARELFNSANGRYEPAPEGRRSSVKQDGFRKPAVLQRPSHGGAAPAEPSAAFQSRTSVQTDGGWGNRRRGSSVSQGSSHAARRMSMQRGHDHPVPVSEAVSQTGARNDTAKPAFSQQSAWNQQMPARPPVDAQPSPAVEAVPAADPALSAEEAAKMQAKVMKEKREIAQKRRKEEEEREAAAKQERLRAKLASLEGAGKSKKERDAEAAAAAATKKTAPASVAQSDPAKPVETAAPLTSSSSTSLEAQRLPPQSEQAQKPISPQAAQPLPTKQQSDRPDVDQAQRQAQRSGPFQQSNPASYKPSASSYSSPGQPFGRSPSNLTGGDSFTPWPTSVPNSNVWGTSGIGNGTFTSSGAFAPVPMGQISSSLPLPPGMNRPTNSARISPQSFDAESRSPHMQQQQIGEQQRAYPPPGMDIDARSDAFGQSRRSGASSAQGLSRQPHPPGPIGPPSRAQHQQHQQQQHLHRAGPAAASAWSMVSNQLPGQYVHDAAVSAAKVREEMNAPPQTATHEFKETFKKTSTNQGPLGAPRRYEKPEYTIHDPSGSRSVPAHSPALPAGQTPPPAAPPSAQTQPPAVFSGASPALDIRTQAVENTVRIPDYGGAPPQQPPIGRPQQHPQAASYHGNANFRMAPLAPSIASKEQSPPPPETDGHPVNEGGDSSHPHVKLPRPLAKVKLPPTSSTVQQHIPMQNGSVLMPQRPNSSWRAAHAPVGATRPLVQNENWQARFNSLFTHTATIQTETPPSPPKTPPKMSLAVASLSRAPLDDQAAGATVYLPQTQKFSGVEIASKPIIDYMFNEELSFGSMPKVNVPRNTAYDNSAVPKHTKNLLKMGPNSKANKPVESQSIRELIFYDKSDKGYFAHIPLTNLNKLCLFVGGERHGGKKPFSSQNHQDRKPATGRQTNRNNRGGKDHGEPAAANSRKSFGPKQSQQAAAAPSANGGHEASTGGPKRGGFKAARGGRPQGTAGAAARVATPAQSG